MQPQRSTEIFRVTFKSTASYEVAKQTIQNDMAKMGLTTPLFTFDEAAQSIVCHHSHFYLRTLMRGTDTSAQLNLDTNTYRYFTNQAGHPDVIVTPNISAYQQRRKEALDYYQAHQPATIQPIDIDLQKASSRELISKLLAHPKSCFGERHDQAAPKAALIHNMPALKVTGAVLLLEHLFTNQQSALNHYLADENAANPAPEIGTYLKHSDQLYPSLGEQGLAGLVASAKKHGVPVMGIEDPFTLDAGAFGAIVPLPEMKVAIGDSGWNKFDRLLLMNHNTAKIAEHLERHGFRSITLCGGAHVSDYTEPSSGKKVTGLASSFGIPVFGIEDKPLHADMPPQTSFPTLYINPNAPESVHSAAAVGVTGRG